MEEAKRVALLEEENMRLREEVEVLFQTVMQLRSSMNLLIGRYVVKSDGQERQAM